MKIVNTDEFWEAMCDIHFVRINMNKGLLRGEEIYTHKPPEQIKGYMQERMKECQKLI